MSEHANMPSNTFDCRQLAPKLKNVGQRVLLLVGEGDWLIPSKSEGKRLETVLARCIVKACAHLIIRLAAKVGDYVKRYSILPTSAAAYQHCHPLHV